MSVASRSLSGREQVVFACLVDTLLAPRPPLPPVSETVAVATFQQWLARFPTGARTGMRALLVALELSSRLDPRCRRPWHTLTPGERLRRIESLERTLPRGRLLGDALRAVAGASYYGDPAAAAAVGYQRPASLR